jgi:hypothetical protein
MLAARRGRVEDGAAEVQVGVGVGERGARRAVASGRGAG